MALIALTVGLWISQFATLTARSALMNMNFMPDISMWRVFTCALGAILCLGVGWIFDRINARSQRAAVIVMILLVIPASSIWSWLDLEILSHAKINRGSPWATTDLLGTAIWMAWVFGAWAVSWIAVRTTATLAEKEIQLSRTNAMMVDSQNKMLRYQLNPHFMFNALSALSLLILQKRNAAAEAVVMNLATFLRVSLERAPEDKVSIADEISMQQQYLEIERARFEDRLVVHVNLSPEAEGCLVPNLIIQPLVENAIKYGVASTDERVQIDIDVFLAGDILNIAVKNTGERRSPAGAPKLGLGLANIRDRLFLLYEKRASLDSDHLAAGGYQAVIRIPVERP